MIAKKKTKNSDRLINQHQLLMMSVILVSALTGIAGITAFILRFDFHNPGVGIPVMALHILMGPAFAYFIYKVILRFRKRNVEKIEYAESRLEESEKNVEQTNAIYKALFNAIPDISRITDKDNKIIAANAAYCKLLGITEQEIIGKEVNVFNTTSATEMSGWNQNIFRTGKTQRREMIFDKNGTAQYYDLVVAPVFNKNAKVIATAGIARDITGMKEANASHLKNIRRFHLLTMAYQKLIEHTTIEDIFYTAGDLIENLLWSPMMIISVYDDKQQVIKITDSRGFGAKTGLLHKLTGIEVKSTVFPLSVIDVDLKESFTSSELHRLENGIYDLACRQIDAHICETLEKEFGVQNVYTIDFNNNDISYGNISLLLTSVLDVEDIKLIEAIMTLASTVVARNDKMESLKISEARYKDLITSSPVMGYSLNGSMQLTFCTEYFYNTMGYTPDEMLLKPITGFLTEASGKYFEDYIYRKITQDGNCTGDELEWIKADGHIMTTLHNGITYGRDETGANSTIEILTDITPRKKAEAALRMSENKYRCLIQQAKAGIAEVSTDHRIMFANDELINMLGYELSELLNKDIYELFGDDEINWVARNFERMQQEVLQNLDVKVQLKNGNIIYFLISSAPVFNESGKTLSIILYVSDVTDRELARQEIKQREEFFRALYEQSPLPYHAMDINGIILDVNSAWLAAFGYTKDEVIGKSLAEFLDEFTTEQFVGIFRDIAAKGGAQNLERVVLHKSGAKRTVIVNAKVVLDKNGNFIQSHSILNDITVKRSAEKELERIHETLEEGIKQRTASLEDANKELDAFAYSVSHDLRSPIRHISGFLELMQLKKGSLDEKTKENYMQIIFESAHKMGSMVDDLLMFSKMSRTEMHKKNINMTGLFKTIYGELTEHLKARTIEFRVDNLPEVIADISMIRLVVTNILSNAIKYSRNVLDATITISSETDSENKKYIYIIEDNGAGFDMNYYDKLFGVFQRLHSQTEFEGTGIGLANAKRIIQRHGGKIWAHSTPGLGARFSFSLPM